MQNYKWADFNQSTITLKKIATTPGVEIVDLFDDV